MSYIGVWALRSVASEYSDVLKELIQLHFNMANPKNYGTLTLADFSGNAPTPCRVLRLESVWQYGREDDPLLAWRTSGEYWNAERTVVVAYNCRISKQT